MGELGNPQPKWSVMNGVLAWSGANEVKSSLIMMSTLELYEKTKVIQTDGAQSRAHFSYPVKCLGDEETALSSIGLIRVNSYVTFW